MKNEEFLRLLGGIDEKLIEKAGKDLEDHHKTATQYAAGGNYRKKLRRRITAAVCTAAAIVGAVVFVNSVGNIRGKRPGVVLSEGETSIPELPIISKPGNTASDTKEKGPFYFNFSLYGDTDTGYYQFSPPAYKNTFWNEPAEILVYRGNIDEKNTAVISVYTEDCLDYLGVRVTDYQVVDHLTTTADQTYFLKYDPRYFDPSDDHKVYLCAETGDEYVKFEGEWTP